MKNIIELTETNFANEITAAETPVLVDFFAPWCGPCKALAPVLEKVAEELAGKIKIAKLNVDEAPGVAAEYGISGVPTLILFKGGQPVEGSVGFVPPAQLTAWLEKHAAVPA